MWVGGRCGVLLGMVDCRGFHLGVGLCFSFLWGGWRWLRGAVSWVVVGCVGE